MLYVVGCIMNTYYFKKDCFSLNCFSQDSLSMSTNETGKATDSLDLAQRKSIHQQGVLTIQQVVPCNDLKTYLLTTSKLIKTDMTTIQCQSRKPITTESRPYMLKMEIVRELKLSINVV